MTASLHKLTAGSGYDYLTRQVAAQDTTEKGHTTLASYYLERGEAPGAWKGSGLVALEDVALGDPVTAEQMKALFGAGVHPNSASRLAALPADATSEQITHAARLGRAFPVHAATPAFRQEVAVRCQQWRQQHPEAAEVPFGVRAEIRNDIATDGFVKRLGRLPSALELSAEVARLSRDASTACAGFDVTFTPVKSVSALWAVAPIELAAQIEQAHNAAVADALLFLEQRALFSREGAGGVRQVDVNGLIAAAFVHRDSRAGDPNLHTHVAIANKVQTLSGKWLAIDGRLVFKSKVAISETYNTQLEAHLAPLGIRFAERPSGDPTKRPVREVVGVPAVLSERWSSRRAAIVARQGELASEFQRDHHRPPTPVELLKLAQQATLETRDAKHEPRTLAQQRAAWRAEAAAVLGKQGIADMVTASTSPRAPTTGPITEAWIDATAVEIVSAVEGARATWQVWHLRAEASRRARQQGQGPGVSEALTRELLRRALRFCQPVGDPEADGISEPAVLRRRDGSSVYSISGAQLYTSRRMVAAEQRIVQVAGLKDGRRVGEPEVSLALLASTANGVQLNEGQVNLVRQMAGSGARVQLALAAAGSGKTTALRVLAEAWREAGGDVLGLAPSAVAAGVLRDQVGNATTVAKLVWDLEHDRPGEGRIGPGTLVIMDEAGMTDTISLAKVVDHVVGSRASVRLIGDDQQLAAIGAGGVLRDIAHTHGAVELTELMRFTDPAEAAVSLALREGRPEALGFYLDNDRIHAGTNESCAEAAFHDWAQDLAEGRDSLMLASTRETVAELNRRAREYLLGVPPRLRGAAVLLADGNQASGGDVIITRMNARRLPISPTDWVKNGDRWTVEQVTAAGIKARHRTSGLSVLLPSNYVADHVHLGYAVTVHSAQGITVDVARGVLTGSESRQQLYVTMTRGRHANHVYTPIVGDGDEHSVLHPTTLRPETAVDVLETILARDGSARSASTESREALAPAARLADAAARYLDALHVAAEATLPASTVQALDQQADHIVHDLTGHPAWPTLRATLILNALDDHDPLDQLRTAAATNELNTAHDPAAVLAWRIQSPTGSGPLPWLPPVPDRLGTHQAWGPYLLRRSELVQELAGEIQQGVHQGGRPDWTLPGQHQTSDVIADVEVWRSATGVAVTDRRATGPLQIGAAARAWQIALERRLNPSSDAVWVEVLAEIHPGIHADPHATFVTQRLSDLHDDGLPVLALLAEAQASGPLPADRPAAALRWRLTARLERREDHGHAETAPSTRARTAYDPPLEEPTPAADRPLRAADMPLPTRASQANREHERRVRAGRNRPSGPSR